MNNLIKPVLNVAESWPIYDTLCVCNTYYGQESDDIGWFNTFAAFAQKETHTFYKRRTEGSVGQMYTNKSTQDTMDFAYEAYSFGISFFAPSCRLQGRLVNGDPSVLDTYMAHYWETELPRHCAIQLKVQQDIVAELPCMEASPGYGPTGAGAAYDNTTVGPTPANGDSKGISMPFNNQWVTAGVPSLSNRWRFPKKIGIPRTATIEAVLHVSEQARTTLSEFGASIYTAWPQNYIFAATSSSQTVGYTEHPARFGIQVSLIGKREVQQRGQYHS